MPCGRGTWIASSTGSNWVLSCRRPPVGLVHHSDRGSQYASLPFGKTPRESGLVASMGWRGAAYDNATCESCISTLKRGWIKRHCYTSRDHARSSIFQYIEIFYYNLQRRHSALGGSSRAIASKLEGPSR